MNTLHALSPNDLERERRFLQRLTPLSKRMRFMGAVGTLSEAQLRRLVTPDPDRELALAWVIDDEFAAVARYALLDATAMQAEFAIVVADEHQGQGIGRRLMRAVIEAAREAGVRELVAECYADNLPMVALFRSEGFHVDRHPEDMALCRVNLRLDAKGSHAHHHAGYQ